MSVRAWPGMTRADIARKIDKCVEKRDHATDVLHKPLLGFTYQQELEEWLEILHGMPSDTSSPPPSSTAEHGK